MAIGARSVEDQQHRFVASGADLTGLENPTSGNLNVMFNGIYVQNKTETSSCQSWEVETSGNPLLMRFCVEPILNREEIFELLL